MTYDESIQFLYDLQMFGANFGLENTRRLAALAGNPQDELKFIHVAGTNGKGSVCAMLESIYRTAGFKTGLYSSPHLIHFGERIRINNQLLGETELIALTERMKQLLAVGAERGWWSGADELPSADRNHPTMFEVVSVMALIHFAENGCEIVLWETGLGGRLDATNIVTPLASVITNVALEHSAYLGDTIEKIAAEKSGIIKPGVPVFTGAENPAVLKVLREVAGSRNAPFISEPDPNSAELAGELFPDSYQQKNANLALTVVKGLTPESGQSDAKKGGAHARPGSTAVFQFEIGAGIQRQALRDFVFPGRLQRIVRGNRTILIDGAHNPASVRALRESLRGKSFPTVFGCFKDKDLTAVLTELLPVVSRLALVPVSSPRSASPQELQQRVRQLNPDLPVEMFESLAAAFRVVADEPEVLVTGSLYLVGEALNLLSAEGKAGAEQSLNDWTASSSR